MTSWFDSPRRLTGAVAALLLSSALTACSTEGDYFFLERQGATMPIWVRGNVGSGTFVLVAHGGPLLGAQWYIDAEAFKALEARYAVVYWDQRGAGSSQGNPPAESYATEALVGDMDAVVAILRARYAPRRLYLLGHSWGGFLMTAWLVDAAHQRGVDGAIMIAGAFDFVHWREALRQALLEKAREGVTAGVDVARWQEALDWAASIVPRPSAQWPADDVTTLSQYLFADYDEFHGKPWDPPLSRILATPLEYPAIIRNSEHVVSPSGYDLFGPRLEEDLTSAMAAIRVPMLITWGRHDLNVPVSFAQQAYDALGTAAASKELIVFEDSAHYPFWNEPARWIEAATTFIDQH